MQIQSKLSVSVPRKVQLVLLHVECAHARKLVVSEQTHCGAVAVKFGAKVIVFEPAVNELLPAIIPCAAVREVSFMTGTCAALPPDLPTLTADIVDTVNEPTPAPPALTSLELLSMKALNVDNPPFPPSIRITGAAIVLNVPKNRFLELAKIGDGH